MPLQIFGSTTCRVCNNSMVFNAQKDTVLLENIQRRATRMVNCLKHQWYNEWLKTRYMYSILRVQETKSRCN